MSIIDRWGGRVRDQDVDLHRRIRQHNTDRPDFVYVHGCERGFERQVLELGGLQQRPLLEDAFAWAQLELWDTRSLLLRWLRRHGDRSSVSEKKEDRKIPTGRSTNSHVELDRMMIGGRLEGVVGQEG